jgi:hypothetical protein
MKMLKMAFVAACALASTTAGASVVQAQPNGAASQVNTCYYEFSILTPDAIYDVYTCYSNGDGSY